MVVVPFLAEAPELVIRTLATAASHPRVREVVGVHGLDDEVAAEVRTGVSGVRLIKQRRIGALRAGKGDAVNTGIEVFLASECDRLHFYDADIKTFASSWIDMSEAGLDRGFETVRHFYPRATTDGMVTAMLVRPAFATCWPESVLARIKQPLAGEVAFSRPAAEALASQAVILRQSDWGIDTVITGSCARLGLSIYENQIGLGKDHQLYGSLADLRTMFWECLQAVRTLRVGGEVADVKHHVEWDLGPIPAFTNQAAFDLVASTQVLEGPLRSSEVALLRSNFEPRVAAAIEESRWDVFDTATWLGILHLLITRANADEEDWHEIAFRLWVGRVLFYAIEVAREGHDRAMAYIDTMVDQAMVHPLN
jgi:mannosylglycerate synthase